MHNIGGPWGVIPNFQTNLLQLISDLEKHKGFSMEQAFPAFPGHGLLVADLAPFLDDIPVKGARESFDSPDLIAVPVPGLWHGLATSKSRGH